ncbi:uncharacterized protein METZ01_LOCUS380081, partial [marine metagenome]
VRHKNLSFVNGSTFASPYHFSGADMVMKAMGTTTW